MLLYTDSLDLDQLEPIITCCFYTSNTYVAIIILTQVQESNLLLIGTFFYVSPSLLLLTTKNGFMRPEYRLYAASCLLLFLVVSRCDEHASRGTDGTPSIVCIRTKRSSRVQLPE